MIALVLLSGGIDSTTCLAMAIDRYGASNVQALCMYYGQKHHKEIQAARDVAQHYGVAITEIDLASIFSGSKSPLLIGRGDIIHESYAEQLEKLGGEGTVDTYVPFRNGLFLSVAASVALSIEAEVIYYGAHADDAAGRAYPDCTPEFERAMHEAIYQGSGRKILMQAPLIDMNKSQVVATGLKLKAPYHLTWSCYEGKDEPCGTCGTCIDRYNAFAINGVVDPAAVKEVK